MSTSHTSHRGHLAQNKRGAEKNVASTHLGSRPLEIPRACIEYKYMSCVRQRQWRGWLPSALSRPRSDRLWDDAFFAAYRRRQLGSSSAAARQLDSSTARHRQLDRLNTPRPVGPYVALKYMYGRVCTRHVHVLFYLQSSPEYLHHTCWSLHLHLDLQRIGRAVALSRHRFKSCPDSECTEGRHTIVVESPERRRTTGHLTHRLT